MKMNIVVAAGVALAGLSLQAETVYKNDFASRTSTEPVPRSDWFTMPYVNSTALFYGYDETLTYTPDLPYSNPSRVQDGWAKIVGNNPGLQLVNFWVRTDSGVNNPYGRFYNQTGQYGTTNEVMAVQSFNNEFSSGTLRISVDMRGPAKKSANFKDGYFRLKMLFKDAINPSSKSYTGYALTFGMNGGNATDYGAIGVTGSKGDFPSPTTKGIDIVAKPDRTHWWRIVADLNLDASTYKCYAYDMGTSQPASDAATPATAKGTAEGYLYRSTANMGPICGFGIHCRHMSAYSAKSSSDTTLVLANCPGVDNLRAWWKPTGDTAAFGEANLVYENDFSTRRYRCVQGTTASTATADALAVPDVDVYKFWGAGAYDNMFLTTNLVFNANSTGRDGWRLVDGIPRDFVVKTTESGGNILAFPLGGNYTKIAHPIGTSITSGKIKFECDFRLPNKWGSMTSRSLTMCLGTDKLYAEKNSGYAIRVGIIGPEGDVNKFHPYKYIDTKGGGSRSDTSVQLTSNYWYRAVVVADMATKKYDYSLYELGSKSGGLDRTMPATPVCSYTGNGFYPETTPAAITTLAIYAYSSGGTTWKTSELADNLRISTGTDGTNWTTVYSNNFTTRKRYGARTTPEATLLNAEFNRPGLDGWMRRDGAGYLGDWIVRDIDGNPCLAYEDEENIVHAQHLLPKPVTRGKLTVRADMRPPFRSTWNSAQTARVYVGGDEYAQGEIGTNTVLRNFREAAAGNFGFTQDGNSNAIGYYSQVKLSVTDGNGTQTAYTIKGDARYNWYRFKATFLPEEKTWRLDVYDQGTTHPTADAPDGTLVQSFENLTFKYDDPTGLTALGLVAGGTAGNRSDEADTNGLLVDNLVVDGTAFGMAIFVK